jgi:ADP-dependent NAD(P)H-hydrate dehydratase / NAD(P)H-hydrate epimerase
MKILSAAQIREADAYTIQQEGISSVDLMERAANACVDWVKKNITADKRLIVFAGTGNNGGDGIAIARLMYQQGYEVLVNVIGEKGKGSPDFLTNISRLEKLPVTINYVQTLNQLQDFKTNDIIIDALFGTGLNKPIEGVFADVIYVINQSAKEVISIDVPSGLFCDTGDIAALKAVVNATHTLTFQLPKFSFLFPETGKHTGQFYILDIGLNKEFIQAQDSHFYYITEQEIKSNFNFKREKFSHKGTFGHALLLVGSYGKAGAAILAAKACLHSGCGLLTLHTAQKNVSAIQAAFPEAMVSADVHNEHISQLPVLSNFDAIGIGSGIGIHEDTTQVLKQLIQTAEQALVLDADAINILAENKTWLAFLPQGSILTPHPKEFERLAGKSNDSFERLQMARELALKNNIIIVLKGAHTAIVSPSGKIYFNSSGNPGMATAGSGDVLTGVITSFLAQGYNSFESALLGAYIHGKAGDYAANFYSQQSLIAGDIITFLSKVFKDFE